MPTCWIHAFASFTAAVAITACDSAGANPSTVDATTGDVATAASSTSSDAQTSTSGSAPGTTSSAETGASTSSPDVETTGGQADGSGTSDSGSVTGSTTGDLCENGQLDAGEEGVDCGGRCEPCADDATCAQPEDCASGTCESGSCLGPARGCDLEAVQGQPGGQSWADSYSVDGRCYCATTFDHNIGGVMVDTPAGPRTVMEVCAAIGPGPGMAGHPIYNDVQCGNGPANDAGDEDWCPGRVDQGASGCCTAGPTWDLSVFE